MGQGIKKRVFVIAAGKLMRAHNQSPLKRREDEKKKTNTNYESGEIWIN